jgi:hypothetical protein
LYSSGYQYGDQTKNYQVGHVYSTRGVDEKIKKKKKGGWKTCSEGTISET